MLYAGDLITNIVYEIDGKTDKVVDNITTAENFQNIPIITTSQQGTIPSAIAVNTNTSMVYVVGPAFDEVFIIDPYINRIVSNITVGSNPVAIAINEKTNKIYVANYDSNSISVIDAKINAVVSNITVGQPPKFIAINPNTNMVYVIPMFDPVVYVIDGKTDKIQAGVTFNIHPANSGHIKCNDKEFATNEFNRIESGVQCAAEPNKGFQFSSWTQNVEHNSSKTISTSAISSDSPFNFLLNALELTPKDNAAVLNVRQYGNFTANFKELPPPIPPAYWIPLYGVIVSSIVGWSIPSIIGWMKSKMQGRRVHHYHKRIASLYDDGKLDQNDIGPLDKLKSNITDAYAKGKISDQHYTNLKNEISILYEEIYKKKIDSLNGKSDNECDGIILDKIKNEITDAYAKGKISDQHYNLLNEKIIGVNKMPSSFEKIATASRTEGSPIKTNK